jgi:hypothetical protein
MHAVDLRFVGAFFLSVSLRSERRRGRERIYKEEEYMELWNKERTSI